MTSEQVTANFTGSGMLAGGDINQSNTVNILDFSLLKINWFTLNSVADINGDGMTSLPDYLIMSGNWYKAGDPR